MFKLIISIEDSGEFKVDFDGKADHLRLLGIFETLKHQIINTVMEEQGKSEQQQG